MDSIFPVFFIVVFVVVLAVLAYVSYQQQQQRLAEMATLAGELGWRFVADSNYSIEDEYSQFSIFTRGHSRYGYNTFLGTIDVNGQPCQATMGDYRYRQTSGSGKSRRTRTYNFSYLAVHLPYRNVPHLSIRSEHVFDSIAGALGFDDIDFESAEFSKNFHVKSADKRFAYDVIHPGMMEYLLANEGPPLEILEGCCCISTGTGTWTANEFRVNLDWARGFFDLWPKHLVATLQSRA